MCGLLILNYYIKLICIHDSVLEYYTGYKFITCFKKIKVLCISHSKFTENYHYFSFSNHPLSYLVCFKPKICPQNVLSPVRVAAPDKSPSRSK